MKTDYREQLDGAEKKIQRLEAILKTTDKSTQFYAVICDAIDALRDLKLAYQRLSDAPDMAMMNELQRDVIGKVAEFERPHTVFAVLVREKTDGDAGLHERMTHVSGYGAHIAMALTTTGLEREDIAKLIKLANDEIQKGLDAC